jgi:hypothetical protein
MVPGLTLGCEMKLTAHQQREKKASRRSQGQALDQLDARRIPIARKTRQGQVMLMQLHQQIAEVYRLA